MNLAVNARDAMPGGGRLLIETAIVQPRTSPIEGEDGRTGPLVRLTVSDTGCGMDSETQARIFEPFFTTKAAGKGTGLGLSIVYGIVRQSGGSLSVQSRPGQGTSFVISLPLAIHPSGPDFPPAKPIQDPATGSETILVVEDDEHVRHVTATMLRARRHRVLLASNGAEALEISQTHEGPIHLLMTDLVMPGMNGLEVAERVAGQRPNIVTLYFSGYPPDAREGRFPSGATVLPKPFTAAILHKAVQTALANGRAES